MSIEQYKRAINRIRSVIKDDRVSVMYALDVIDIIIMDELNLPLIHPDNDSIRHPEAVEKMRKNFPLHLSSSTRHHAKTCKCPICSA